jgi:molybdopterin synthase catalytic subunit
MRVISIVGYKKTGKTTLVERLVTELSKLGKVGTVKHTNEEIMPILGDTERHMDSGSIAVVAVTPTRSIKVKRETRLEDAIKALEAEGVDFIVVEGFKKSSLPKIALGDVEADNIVARVSIDAPGAELVKIALAQPEQVTLDSLIAKIRSNPDIKKAGAIGTFTGIVREVAGNEVTKYLEFESYDEMAAQRVANIAEDLKRKEGIVDVLIHHKTGRIMAGEDIVYIVIATGHRQELFPALSEAIERIKDEVPIWKKEITIEDEFWVHDRH